MASSAPRTGPRAGGEGIVRRAGKGLDDAHQGRRSVVLPSSRRTPTFHTAGLAVGVRLSVTAAR